MPRPNDSDSDEDSKEIQFQPTQEDDDSNESDSDDANASDEECDFDDAFPDKSANTDRKEDNDSNDFTVESVPIDEENYLSASSIRDNVEDPQERELAKYKEANKTTVKQRDPRYLRVAALAFIGALICAILIVILHFTIGQDKDDDSKKKNGSPPSPLPALDPNWVETVKAAKTTPFDAYDLDNPSCDFSAVNQPNTMLQCQCGDTIDIIADDIQEMYDELRVVLIPALYGTNWPDMPVDSCAPENQALLWLASGDTRQNADDLRQRYVLALLYADWQGTDWDDSNNWWSNGSECDWLYITCNGEQKVSSLGLDEINLFGTLPTELVLLSQLRGLSITRNHLEGTIPSELMTLTTLETLSLYDNTLTGPVPTEIADLDNLRLLRLQQNELSGSLASQVGAARNLEELKLGFNSMMEAIPTELGQLTKLRTLALEENNYSGFIPSEFGKLTDLRELVLNELLLTGAIPSELGRLKKVRTLQIIGSGISREIPRELGNAQSLNRLDINDNKLEGKLPSELGKLTDLYFFAANDNRLTGALPSEYGLMTNMTRFVVFDNDLTGTVPMEFGEMAELDVLSLYQNKFTGVMPAEVCANQADKDGFDVLVTCAEGDGEEGIQCPDGCCICKKGRRW